MGYYADIYVGLRTRSKEKAIAFLDHFLPERGVSGVGCPFPVREDQSELIDTDVNDLMMRLEREKNVNYSLYWHSIDKQNPNRNGMLFYTNDGAIIFGISRDVLGNTSTSHEDECLDAMKEYLKTDIGYITYESPPPDSYTEFKKIVASL